MNLTPGERDASAPLVGETCQILGERFCVDIDQQPGASYLCAASPTLPTLTYRLDSTTCCTGSALLDAGTDWWPRAEAPCLK